MSLLTLTFLSCNQESINNDNTIVKIGYTSGSCIACDLTLLRLFEVLNTIDTVNIKFELYNGQGITYLKEYEDFQIKKLKSSVKIDYKASAFKKLKVNHQFIKTPFVIIIKNDSIIYKWQYGDKSPVSIVKNLLLSSNKKASLRE